ncbi:uncharacterized protein MONBRDRAFT_32186 [Monosiga brevicollis MX1]|uniref:RRM domain-containing protein n=1 Tax=Monosiga brevicollis TaxID=81824 RepID=A9UY72_MONBE|nr:uncharacterized protein MONBRDRAFT_32186 [Monosiga brevicollis MX1]EDQ89972.1 predicted protein [Monosiga brevicollis MX1]|eukprot:XP_001745394.1 hypothetical protein [Monosiga brevicollis MX1]
MRTNTPGKAAVGAHPAKKGGASSKRGKGTPNHGKAQASSKGVGVRRNSSRRDSQKRTTAKADPGEPSPVILLSNLEVSSRTELAALLSYYGPVRHMTFLKDKTKALAEYMSQASAEALVASGSLRQFNRSATVIFSSHDHIALALTRTNEVTNPPSRVLSINICNCPFDPTLEFLHAQMARYGQVLRIVTIRKDGDMQVLAEYAQQSEATVALNALQNETLSIRNNTSSARDFTVNGATTSIVTRTDGQALAEMRVGPQHTTVLLHNWPTGLNVHHAVALACVYGNVDKCVMVPSSRTILIQFQDEAGQQAFSQHVSKLQLLGSQLNVTTSKQEELRVQSKRTLEDGSPQGVDVSKDAKLRRFKPNERGGRTPPSNTLHFHNVPQAVSLETLLAAMAARGAPAPVSIRNLTQAGKPTQHGLLTFSTEHDALVAVVKANNMPLPGVADRILKVAFSRQQS